LFIFKFGKPGLQHKKNGQRLFFQIHFYPIDYLPSYNKCLF